MRYWLMKSEPSVFSITDLQRMVSSIWDGVRNYQARNFLRQMRVNDRVFFYHSNTDITGIYGLAFVSKTQLIDPTQFDPTSPYFDEKSSEEKIRWDTVEVTFLEKWTVPITLAQMKEVFMPEEFLLVKKGNRLSVMPVDERIWQRILAMHVNHKA